MSMVAVAAMSRAVVGGGLLTISLMVSPVASNSGIAAVSGAEGPTQGEIVVARDKFSTTTQRSLGSFETRISATPVNYLTSEGDWQPIQNTLVASDEANVAFENVANSYDLTIPEEPAVEPIALVTDEHSIEFQLRGSRDIANVENATASVDLAMTDAYLNISAVANGVKEEIILESRPNAAPTFIYDLSLDSNLEPRLRDDGSIALNNRATGVESFAIPAPYMFDSGTDLAQRRSELIAVDLQTLGADRYVLSMRPSWQWLSDPATQFPITIDPTIVKDSERTCWIGSTVLNTSNCAPTEQFLRVGSNASGAQRSLLKFNLGAIPADATVLTANLSMYLNSARTTRVAAANYEAWPIAESWTPNATWSSPDSSTQRYWPGSGPFDANNAFGGPLDIVRTDGSSSGWFTWDLGSAVDSWTNSGETNFGFTVKQASENVDSTLFFNSASSVNGGRAPTFVVEWDDIEVSPEPTLDRAALDGTHACAVADGIAPTSSTTQQTLGWVDANGRDVEPTGTDLRGASGVADCFTGSVAGLIDAIAAPDAVDDAVAVAEEWHDDVRSGHVVPRPEAVEGADTTDLPDSFNARVDYDYEARTNTGPCRDYPTRPPSFINAFDYVYTLQQKYNMLGRTFIREYCNPTWMQYATDGCSSILPDRTRTWNFTWACRRHDFGWRNLKRSGEYYFGRERRMFFRSNKAVADNKFIRDMIVHCNQNWPNSFSRRSACKGVARLAVAAVRQVYPFTSFAYGARVFSIPRDG